MEVNVKKVYHLAELLPLGKKNGLRSQISRAVSIKAEIAELVNDIKMINNLSAKIKANA